MKIRIYILLFSFGFGVLQAQHSFSVVEDILWSSPKGFDLTMDIYTPETGKENYPVIVMYHGGGWLINNNSIMDQSAQYLAEYGEYVVCNVNYRLLGDLDNSTTLNEIIEDAYGALLWVKSHVAQYQGNPKKITVTGDSAGGHLAIAVATMGKNLSGSRFSKKPYGFQPTWMPEGKSPEELAQENALAVQCAIISYGAFDLLSAAQGGFEKPENFFWTMGGAAPRGILGKEYNAAENEDMYKAISPLYNISSSPMPPMLFTVGSEDQTTPPESILRYLEAYESAGHTNYEYWVHKGRPHAFLDSGSNEYLGIEFNQDAVPALVKMINYLNDVFYHD